MLYVFKLSTVCSLTISGTTWVSKTGDKSTNKQVVLCTVKI